MPDPSVPDPNLWVTLTPNWSPDPDLRWSIHGNAFTHWGHFHVCSVTGHQHRSVNLSSVAEISPKARVWLHGFLQGQQVSDWEYFGSDDELLDAATDEDYERWREWNREFLRRGYGSVNALPPGDPLLSRLGPPTPWCHVAGRFRVWTGSVWSVADPQPTTSTPWFWPGSQCQQLDEHSFADAGSVSLCERCHEVTAD